MQSLTNEILGGDDEVLSSHLGLDALRDDWNLLLAGTGSQGTSLECYRRLLAARATADPMRLVVPRDNGQVVLLARISHD